MIQKTKMKEIFHKEGIQINIEALNMLDDHVKRLARIWALRCANGNVKRLTPKLIWIALNIKDKETL